MEHLCLILKKLVFANDVLVVPDVVRELSNRAVAFLMFWDIMELLSDKVLLVLHPVFELQLGRVTFLFAANVRETTCKRQ